MTDKGAEINISNNFVSFFYNRIGQKSYILDYNFPDETVASAGRFCRSPDRGGFPPWCFSTNPDEDWEYCGVSKCEGTLFVLVKYCKY